MNPKSTIITTKHFPQLSYNSYGAGPAIMLIHGFPASGILWRNLVSALAESYTVLVPDVPGAGASRLEGESATIDELATTVPAILDSAGVDACMLAGHSMGGYIALAAADLYESRVRGLCLVHSTARADDEERREKRRKSIELIRKGGKDPFIRGMVPTLFSDAFKTGDAAAVGEWINEGLKLAPESMIAFYSAMMQRPDRTEVIANAAFPVQWIAGKDDALIPYISTLQQSALAGVSFVSLYGDCGHMSMIEQPKKLTMDLRRFAEYCLNSRILEEVTT